VSTILVGLISLAIILGGTTIDDLASLVNFGALTAFLILHITVINHFIIRKKSKDYLKHLIFPLIGLIIIGYGSLAKELGFFWISIGLIYMILMKLLHKEGFISE